MTRLFKALYDAYRRTGWYHAGVGEVLGNCYLKKGEICELEKSIRIGYSKDVVYLKAVVFNRKLTGNIKIYLKEDAVLFPDNLDELVKELLDFRENLQTLVDEKL